MVLGTQEIVDKFEALLASKYQYKKLANLGFEEGDSRGATFLNRIITLTDGKVRKCDVEADSRHAEVIIAELGLQNSNGLDAPALKLSAEKQIQDSQAPLLDKVRCVQYRSLTMRGAYLAQDRIDINEATKTLARDMKTPRESSWERLVRLGKYLVKHKSLSRTFEEQQLPEKIRTMVDSDHAGCAVTRKSTTGMVSKLGKHTVKHSCNLQSTIGLSSGESEFYALVKGFATVLGMQSLLADWGFAFAAEVASDSSAARGHVQRRGLGKARHIQTRYLWIQERVGEGHVKIVAVPGKINDSDILTKSVSGAGIRRALLRLGFNVKDKSLLQKETKAMATLHYG
jgi:hypothetical protein